MLTLQADTFGLVPVRYSNLLPSIITQSPRTRRCHTALHRSRSVYDRLTLWKAASRRTHQFRAACSHFATICVAIEFLQRLFFATLVLCNFCSLQLWRICPCAVCTEFQAAIKSQICRVFWCTIATPVNSRGHRGGISELAGCYCNIIEVVTLVAA